MPETVEQLVQTVRSKWDPQFDVVTNDFAPWALWNTAVAESKVSLVTTGGVYLKNGMHQTFEDRQDLGDPSFREFPSVVTKADLTFAYNHSDEHYIDTDMNVAFPLELMHSLAAEGQIGSVAPFAYSFLGYCTRPISLLSNYAPSVAYRMKRMGPDVALIVAMGEVGHQTAALVARAIELAGVPTVVLGTNRAVLEAVKAPRSVVVRHPEGSPVGIPGNTARQRQLILDALNAAWDLEGPGMVAELPYEWKGI